MLLLTDIIQDEEVGAAPFSILRDYYVFSEGEPVPAKPSNTCSGESINNVLYPSFCAVER